MYHQDVKQFGPRSDLNANCLQKALVDEDANVWDLWTVA